MRERRTWMTVCLLLVLYSTASSSVSLVLRGTVIDSSGAAIVNAKVILVALDTSESRTTVSNATGDFSFSDLSPGKYRLAVLSTGFKGVIKDISIGVGQTESVRIQLDTEELKGAGRPPPPPEPPVYNAIFKPVYPGTTTQLYDGQRTRVRFFVGPSDSTNGLSLKNWSVNPKILSAKGIVPLSVTMNCTPCATNSVQTQAITYDAKKKRSSEAVFAFVPTVKLARTGVSNLIFSVSTKGVELDRIVADVGIGQRAVPAAMQSEHAFSAELPSGVNSDLTLIFSSEPSGDLSVQIDPANPDLIAKFNKRHLAGGQLRRFPISVNETELQLFAFNAYVNLRGIVDQYDKPVQQALAAGPSGGTQLSSSASVKFNAGDYKKVVGLLNDVGTLFYRRLFVDEGVDPDLRDLMLAVRNFDIPGRPLRLRISAKNLHFPWQLLHPPASSDEKLFWGFRYILTVDSLGRSTEGRLPGPLIMDSNSNQIFVVYKEDGGSSQCPTSPESSKDEVSQLACLQLAHYKQDFGSKVQEVHSNTELLQLLKSSGATLKTLVAYAHATSGMEFQTQPNGAVTAAPDIRGPRLLFASDNFVTPFDIESLMNNLDESHTSFFKDNPLVFLNACETGTGGLGLFGGPSFPVTLLHMGARGVIATESPVWAYFAYHFGNDLIDELRKGVPAPEALFKIRQNYLGAGNPLGLLYSYYGAPDVQIVE